MLTIVPTPIGNLEDITLRSISAFLEADYIAAEDTRRTSILLRYLRVSRPLISFHRHNEVSRTAELVAHIKGGYRVALSCDAGIPAISDPGYQLISACIQEGLPFTVLPGPSAVLTALVGSGLPCHKFYFAGFLPVKSGKRAAELRQAATRPWTSVYFESPYRLVGSLSILTEICPSIPVCVAREISKKFEEYRRGTAGKVLAHFTVHPPKGEIVLLIHGNFSYPLE
ncbi:MAG: 16S rRNA (cytidine(1402)-2'-O)-methyltransferase [Candidatus Xiphinematobacter sp.]|nr:MAG: 16S rRNA (cytidine(1402)-2'-O)-methyltransferase [Candidatus Xiphinematobacter sp.]QQY09730.1 MAG: 16S rRNA (cytidine(1402)-2'-O)-methyltransferase [Candidatus Xiphinematobacter sp.]QQY10473.1 MAG: 16S rRNA (cytidine(1402)-2'-O)-methyltransferase [Candidatus Xiphinematobacter sp.]QQY11209.1 MAG: 16S rRNA (cytidine(1402)-2'-O)-methyltransferase [Candidatus Xiphinematobacter sp.]